MSTAIRPHFPISFDSSQVQRLWRNGFSADQTGSMRPGGNVRSSVVGGGYQQFSGTSMAAPTSPGSPAAERSLPRSDWGEILLALYFSIDLVLQVKTTPMAWASSCACCLPVPYRSGETSLLFRWRFQ